MKSMTGFGRGEASHGNLNTQVELASVNRRQLDILVYLPRDFVFLEKDVRAFLTERLTRGRVTVKVTVQNTSETREKKLIVDRDLAGQYAEHHASLANTLNVPLAPLDLTRAQGVFEVEARQSTEETVSPSLLAALESAFAGFVAMRQQEGDHLAEVLSQSLATARSLVSQMRERSPTVIANHRAALHKRLTEAELPFALDDERLVKEIGLFADRCSIDEELDRLDSHFIQLESYLKSTEPVGRQLDFLAQEMNREFNTVGSKANDAPLSHLVVLGKAEIEKIREQVQNIE